MRMDKLAAAKAATAAIAALVLVAGQAAASDGAGHISRDELRLAGDWLRAADDGVERRPTKRLVERTYGVRSLKQFEDDPVTAALYAFPGPRTAEFSYVRGRAGRLRLIDVRTVRLG
jgi:hypothetical protein